MDSISHFLANYFSDPQAMGLGGSLLALAIAYGGGLLASLTPCVYPMIPITVSVVGGIPGKPGRRDFREVAARSASYIGGMVAVYSFLGVVAGLTGKVFGAFTNTSGWYLTLGIILSLSALLMMEVIPFDPVTWWENYKRRFGKNTPANVSGTHHREMTLVGAFALGASSGFIAAPCTTPVLTAILAFIAKTQSIPMGLGLMIAFSLGMSTLLLLIAFFTGALQVLPRSGQWMKTLKLVSGILLLAFGEYLIYRAGRSGGL